MDGAVEAHRVFWLLQSAVEVPAGEEWLDAEELAYLSELGVEKRRRDWRLGRWTAKCALAATLGMKHDPATLRRIGVRSASNGAPYACVEGLPIERPISISHSHGLSLCAVGSRSGVVGCDVELIVPHTDAFVVDYFTAGERQRIEAATDTAGPRISTLYWSAKESVLKAVRLGLSADTRSAEVDLPEDDPQPRSWQPLSVRYAPERRSFQGWWCTRGAHVLTLVAEPAPTLPEALSAVPRLPTEIECPQ